MIIKKTCLYLIENSIKKEKNIRKLFIQLF